MRLFFEGLGLLVALIGIMIGYYVGNQQAHLQFEAFNLSSRQSDVAVIETISRYISIMGGNADTDTGNRGPYSTVAGKHNTESAEIAGVPENGQLYINEPIVQTIESIATRLAEIHKGTLETGKDFQSDPLPLVKDPLKALSTSFDPTLAAGGLVALARIKARQDDRAPEQAFQKAMLQMVAFNDVDLSSFDLSHADFRRTLLTGVTLAACRLASTRFERATIMNTTLSDLDCPNTQANRAPIHFRGVALGGGSETAGLRLSNTTGEVALKFTEAKPATHGAEEPPVPIFCEDSAINLELTNSNLSNSSFSNCTIAELTMDSGSSLAASRFNGGSIKNAVFTTNSLVDASFSNTDLSLSNFVWSGIDLKNVLNGSNVNGSVFPEGVRDSIRASLRSGDAEIENGQRVWLTDQAGSLVAFIEKDPNMSNKIVIRTEADTVTTARQQCEEQSSSVNSDPAICSIEWFQPH